MFQFHLVDSTLVEDCCVGKCCFIIFLTSGSLIKISTQFVINFTMFSKPKLVSIIVGTWLDGAGLMLGLLSESSLGGVGSWGFGWVSEFGPCTSWCLSGFKSGLVSVANGVQGRVSLTTMSK